MATQRKSIHGQWSGRLAFILAATGSAVGLGNVWKFPYIAGENGGGAFVLIYLLCIAVIGIPIMMAEVLIGRRGRQSPINTMRDLAHEEGASPHWQWLGWAGVVAGFLILSYYSVIAGWALAYVFRAAAGLFTGLTADGGHAQGYATSPSDLCPFLFDSVPARTRFFYEDKVRMGCLVIPLLQQARCALQLIEYVLAGGTGIEVRTYPFGLLVR